jgi:AraC family transcriptional regulator of adaptative response/methylated-DNA-[protein]-cysteine methyltransferase
MQTSTADVVMNPPAPAALTQIQRACAYIERRADQRLRLKEIAAHVGVSAFHLQRLFSRIVGISPRAYQDALRAGRFRQGLRTGAGVADAVYDAGYGSSSRVYERRPTGRGMTPAAYKQGGKGAEVEFTIASSPLGRLLVAGTPRGVCSVKLGDADGRLEQELRQEYPQAVVRKGPSHLSAWVSQILDHLKGRAPHLELPVDVQATAFQWKVWRYLQSIPYGETRAYSQVARDIGAPASTRAVARACATNPVALVVPCHRVVQKDGGLAGYRWGVDRKRRLLEHESK